jgi:patatin-like phospholipase/acyl hydrolase
MSDKKHYYLIAGLVMFTFKVEGNDEPQVSSVPVNAIVRHDNTKFPAAKLAKAQQNMHAAFMMKMPEEARAGITVHDMVVQNVSYLGEMTEEEFQAPPEGMTLTEAVPEVL